MIEIEPHPKLIEYFNIISTFRSDLQVNIFTDLDENYNIISNIDQNIFLLKKLKESNLLLEKNHICDCGLGLGLTLYEIYLQSLDLEYNFQFTGIEKQPVYVDFIKNNLLHLWPKSFEIIQNDLMNQKYSEYNIIYSYSPFSKASKLFEMYRKITNEVKSGTIIIENANKGLGHFNLLEKIDNLEKITLDDIFVFRKK